MAMYKSPGTENLRGKEKVKTGASWDYSPSDGKDCGGKSNMRAQARILTGYDASTPKGSNEHQLNTDHFSDGKV